jgi:hypothetical protein
MLVCPEEERALVRQGGRKLDCVGFAVTKVIISRSDEEKFDHLSQKPMEVMRRPFLNHTVHEERYTIVSSAAG